MRIFMRFLLTVYLLAVIFAACVVLACAWDVIQAGFPQTWLSLLYTDYLTRVIVSASCIAVIAVSLSLMFYGLRRRSPKAALIKDTGLGAISISINAVEEMAARHIAANRDVKNARVSVRIKDSKADFSAKLAIAEGANIPETLSSLQASLKEQIEALSGIEVSKVTMLVEKTSQAVKPRVE